MPEAPTGTITFVFTDIEGSSRLWENHTDAMTPALQRHDALLREAFEANGGHIFKTVGDAFCVAFGVASHALQGAVAAQMALQKENWEGIDRLRVRMALHTGSADQRDNDYFGPALNRVSRLLSAAHGGQVLLTLATEELVRDHLPAAVALRDLGERRLRDLNRPERIYQVLAPDLPSEFPMLRSLETFPNNLPVQLTSFIGREKEMVEVKRLMGTTHLLTLTGTGGTGKTRLSLQVAADLLDQYPDGVWLVELATIEDAPLVAPGIANILNVREEPEQPILLTLTNYLRNKKLMLVLDNCEHVVAECARLAASLLRACPGLQILASSREPLAIAGESVWPVPSLGVPDRWRDDMSGPDAAEKLTQYEAVRLFIDRAVAVRPGFEVTNLNAPYVAEICWRLDGIPLAIELAAARIRVLSLDQIATRLDDRFRLLTGGSRTAMPRQQTLRALIDWSFDLLTEQERILLRRLAVFAGGRTLAGVEAVCSGGEVQDWEVIDLLTSLVDKSLVTVEKSPGKEPRYTLLESVWEYGREKLAASGESDELRRRHLEYFLGIVRELAPALMGPEQFQRMEDIKVNSYNYRYAFDTSVEVPGLAAQGLEMVTFLERYWEMRGLLNESRERFGALLAHPDNAAHTARRAGALAVIGRLDWLAERTEEGRAETSEALEIYRELNDEPRIGAMTTNMALYDIEAGRFEESERLLAESEEIAVRLGDRRLLAGVRRAQAIGAGMRREFKRALELSEECNALYTELGDLWFISIVQWFVGVMATCLGKFDKARANFRNRLESTWALGNRWAVAHLLEAFAMLAVAEGKFARGARLLGAAEAMRTEFGISVPAEDQPVMREIFARGSEEFVKPEMAAARKEGRSMASDKAVAYALSGEE